MNKEISQNIHYIGVNDRTTHRFEQLWPLPNGVSYNSYLIVDEKTVLIDTLDTKYIDIFIDKIKQIIGDRDLDYVVVNHMEPDHSSSISILKEIYPKVQIVGNAKTISMIEGYHASFEDSIIIKEGESLSIGGRELFFYMTPMLHWPETMVTYDPKSSTLFTGDAFGCYGALNGGVIDSSMNTDIYREEMIRYYSNIVGKYGAAVQKALIKLGGLKIETICSTHGPIWREQKDEVIALYDKLSRYDTDKGLVIAYGSMYGNTAQMAESIAAGASDAGVKDIVIHNVTTSHASYILKDIFKYNGLVIGSPTYSNDLFPDVASLLKKIETRSIKNRVFGCFGSYSWASNAKSILAQFPEKMSWNMPVEPIEMKQGFSNEWDAKGYDMGQKLALHIK